MYFLVENMDPNLERRVTEWLEEENRDDEVIESESDGEEVVDVPIEQEDRRESEDGVSDSEFQSSDDDDMPISELRQNIRMEERGTFYLSGNGSRWSSRPPIATQTRTQNIRVQSAGPNGAARNAETPLSCFELYFDEAIFEKFVTCTNIYIESIKHKYQRERNARQTDFI